MTYAHVFVYKNKLPATTFDGFTENDYKELKINEDPDADFYFSFSRIYGENTPLRWHAYHAESLACMTYLNLATDPAYVFRFTEDYNTILGDLVIKYHLVGPALDQIGSFITYAKEIIDYMPTTKLKPYKRQIQTTCATLREKTREDRDFILMSAKEFLEEAKNNHEAG